MLTRCDSFGCWGVDASCGLIPSEAGAEVGSMCAGCASDRSSPPEKDCPGPVNAAPNHRTAGTAHARRVTLTA
jgi:hypothetical protein